MEVICIQDTAFYALIDKIVDHLKAIHGNHVDRWIDGDEAMRLLNIKSKTSLQNLRDEGKICFSQPQKKIILYDRESIGDYIEKNARNTF